MIFVVIILSYVIGSIPFGFLVVKTFSGRDVRDVGSGRTGGTNAMRAAGVPAGLLTAVLDTLKAAACVWMARLILPADMQVIGMVLAGLFAIVGHNYSVFLGFKGGAGGAPTVGAALAIWPWSFVIAVPLCMVVLFGVGYASLATIAAGLIITVLFAYRTYVLHAPDAPAAFILYGVGSLVLLLWALRPNIRRLLRGEERLIGWRAKRLKQAAAADTGAKGR
jgi:acyl phosphate:glycerol-3-phosphate acyltransferase